ncbi:MAG: hypothetical protein AAFS10_23015 [Myxococcota bacterium]
MDTRTLFAPGKLFVFGEWSVLEGAPAMLVEAPAGQRGVLRLQAPSADAPVLHYRAPALFDAPLMWRWDGERWCADGANPHEELGLLTATLDEANRVLGPPQHSLDLEVTPEGLFATHKGSQPKKLGFGSSGSICALLARALACASQTADEGLDLERVFRVAFKGHRRAQGGRGSGADVAVSVYGGLVAYRLDPPPGLKGQGGMVEPEASVAALARRDDVQLTAVWTGQEADTRVLMSAVQRFEQRNPSAYGIAIRAVGDAASAGCAAWRSGRVSDVLEAVRVASDSLEALGKAAGVELMVPEHRAIATVVHDAVGDAAATKLSGAGGGDMALVVSSDGEIAERTHSALMKMGWMVLPLLPNP